MGCCPSIENHDENESAPDDDDLQLRRMRQMTLDGIQDWPPANLVAQSKLEGDRLAQCLQFAHRHEVRLRRMAQLSDIDFWRLVPLSFTGNTLSEERQPCQEVFEHWERTGWCLGQPILQIWSGARNGDKLCADLDQSDKLLILTVLACVVGSERKIPQSSLTILDGLQSMACKMHSLSTQKDYSAAMSIINSIISSLQMWKMSQPDGSDALFSINPNDPTYSKVIQTAGGLDCLDAIGFKEYIADKLSIARIPHDVDILRVFTQDAINNPSIDVNSYKLRAQPFKIESFIPWQHGESLMNVSEPRGKYMAGSMCEIKWETPPSVPRTSKVIIEITSGELNADREHVEDSTLRHLFWISKQHPNTGLYKWLIPSEFPPGPYYKARVILLDDAGEPKDNDQSYPFLIFAPPSISGRSARADFETDEEYGRFVKQRLGADSGNFIADMTVWYAPASGKKDNSTQDDPAALSRESNRWKPGRVGILKRFTPYNPPLCIKATDEQGEFETWVNWHDIAFSPEAAERVTPLTESRKVDEASSIQVFEPHTPFKYFAGYECHIFFFVLGTITSVNILYARDNELDSTKMKRLGTLSSKLQVYSGLNRFVWNIPEDLNLSYTYYIIVENAKDNSILDHTFEFKILPKKLASGQRISAVNADSAQKAYGDSGDLRSEFTGHSTHSSSSALHLEPPPPYIVQDHNATSNHSASAQASPSHTVKPPASISPSTPNPQHLQNNSAENSAAGGSAARFSSRLVGVESIVVKVPILGLLKLPLVGLIESLQDLYPFVDDLDQYAKYSLYMAKSLTEKPNNIHYGLSVDEAASVFLYTLEFAASKSLYRFLNESLRSEDRKLLRPYVSYLRLLMHSLQKLPRLHGTFYRAVRVPLSATGMTKIGQEMTWWCVSSMTKNVSALETFCGTDGDRTVFAVKTGKGLAIQSFSSVSIEDEVVLLPGTHLKVVGFNHFGHGLSFVQLEEIDAPFQTIS